MSLFKKMRDSVVGRLAPKAGEIAAKAAAKQAKKKLAEVGKKVEAALFGERDRDDASDERPSKDDEATKEALALETREKLEAAHKRVEDRRKREAEEERNRATEAKERAARAARVEREIDDDLAALKNKLGRK